MAKTTSADEAPERERDATGKTAKRNQNMRMLVSNDDGIYSPGIAVLADAASRFGEVRIVAPDVEQSSMGQAITSNRPLTYRRTPLKNFDAYRVNGTPADCVALGVHLWEKVDWVLSGINLGPNLGTGLWHSGTLAAAKQAVLLGLRGIAFSTPTKDDDPRFEELRPQVEDVLRLLMQESSPRLLNVNISPNARGIRWTRQSIRQYDGKMVLDEDPMGRAHYWFTVVPIREPEANTDRWAVENGWISITPLRLDLTDDAELEKLTTTHQEYRPRTLSGGRLTIKTIPARITRNVKEDPSIQETTIWNVETVLLEKLPDQEVSLVADPKEIGVEQIPGSKLDSTRTVFTIRTQGRSPLKEGDTIQVRISEIPSREKSGAA